MDDVAAIEQISRNCFRSFAGFPNAQLIDDGALFGVMSHVPITFFSGIASTRFDGDVEAQVARTINLFREQRCAFRWWLTPSTRPHGLAAILAAQGMRHAYDAPGMIADLATVALDVPLPADVSIRRARNVSDLTPWTDVFMPVFSRPPAERAIWRDAYERFGFDDDAAWTHFIAFLGEEPVATTTLLVDGAVAGVYHVATLPVARGRGIGAAVTRAAMRFARERGATRAALQSSDSGFRVYQSLGFVHRCDLSLYDWKPE
jgi:GNAT superfamily N-acetyltransferase